MLCRYDFSMCLMFCSQEVPPTPGQPVKEPMFIPIALGLLDSKGNDMQLASVYCDGVLKMLAENNGPVSTTVLRITKVCSYFSLCAVVYLL